MALDVGRSSLDFPFWQNHFWNHGLHELTRIGREDQGYAWASQAGGVFSNPFTSELERDYETPSPILLRKWPCDTSSEILGSKYRVALGSQAGRCCEKASASSLASVFSTTNPAFAQRINPVLFGFPIRVYPSHPWLKAILDFRCANDLVTRVLRFFTGNW
jgi:hypothetical protein